MIFRSHKQSKMKYRKKPVIIEAEQYNFLDPNKNKIEGVCTQAHDGIMGEPHIHTLEGIHNITDGDFIITGVKGERYPCKKDIFEMTYEKV